MDTNVLVAAFRSRTGASFEVIRLLQLGFWTPMLSNHLNCEYEEILKRNALELNLSHPQIDVILNTISARCEEWRLGPHWTPVLHDPDDEPLVQLALESGAGIIVTHNLRDLRPALNLGIQLLKPSEFLLRI